MNGCGALASPSSGRTRGRQQLRWPCNFRPALGRKQEDTSVGGLFAREEPVVPPAAPHTGGPVDLGGRGPIRSVRSCKSWFKPPDMSPGKISPGQSKLAGTASSVSITTRFGSASGSLHRTQVATHRRFHMSLFGDCHADRPSCGFAYQRGAPKACEIRGRWLLRLDAPLVPSHNRGVLVVNLGTLRRNLRNKVVRMLSQAWARG